MAALPEFARGKARDSGLDAGTLVRLCIQRRRGAQALPVDSEVSLRS